MELEDPSVGGMPMNRISTGVPGLDLVLDGGLPAGSVCLVVGSPGTGKTTLGSQIAYHRAAQGDAVVYATLFAESHDRLLARLRSFSFVDPALVGTRVHYVSLADALESGGLDGVLAAVRREVRDRKAGLFVVDGATLLETLAPRPVDYVRFVQGLGAVSGLRACTMLLLSGAAPVGIGPIGPHTDGVVQLDLDSFGARDARTLRVVKFRGTEHLLGRHDLTISSSGMAVYPRLESLIGVDREDHIGPDRLSTGVPGLDQMLAGGLLPNTSTMLLGTPGSGKTMLGLHVLARGASVGERGLIATFHEKAPLLIDTAASAGLDLAGPLNDGLLRVLWRAPLELSADAWAWDLLAAVDAHRPTRLLIDGLSDIQRLILMPQRMATYVPALANELRRRGITTIMTVEVDKYVGTDLSAPIPAASATMDNGILLRHVEIRSRIYRLVSILKTRQSTPDSSIREFVIGPDGIQVGKVFDGAVALLTGAASPAPAGLPGEAVED